MDAKVAPRIDDREAPTPKRVPEAREARPAAADAADEEPRHR